MKKFEGRYHYQECGLDNIYLNGGVFVTEVDGEECYSITDIEGLHKVIALDLINQQSPLCAKQFRFLRHELGLTQKELAAKIDCTDQSIALYEKGRPIPMLVDAALRDLYKRGLFSKAIETLTAQKKKTVTTKPKNAVFKLNSKTGHYTKQANAA